MPELDKKTQERLKKLDVAVVYAFGSKVQKAETAFSDIDIGIVFTNDTFLNDPKSIRKKYNELYDILSEAYHPSFIKELDLVFLQQASVSLQYQAISKGKVIFETSGEFTANYEEGIIDEYLDFKHVLNYIDNLIIKRIA